MPISTPEGSIVDAASWLQQLLLGTIAGVVAMIAIAGVGLAMLTGRFEVRRGGLVVLGCFILFGASAIAAGLREVLGVGERPQVIADVAPPPPVAALPQSVPRPPDYDPYGGAAMPQQR